MTIVIDHYTMIGGLIGAAVGYVLSKLIIAIRDLSRALKPRP